jgi:uncharacterized protein YyaL (SSP411 family)
MPDTSAPMRNRLSQESSPYLLQHAGNPVAWQAWGPQAFAIAKRENKPVLLSVGYAACHWCHVMAHESFEDAGIAGLMNDLFVNIKVDREERPDVDSIYQQALALLGEHGGWPLTMFLTPDGAPFWGGTYFPPTPRYGRPGFPQVLQTIAQVYRDDPERVAHNVTALTQALDQLSRNASGAAVALDTIDKVADRLLQEVDPLEGGLGPAPKFPQCPTLKLLWRAWTRRHAEPFRHAVELTLDKMCQGGIYDHLGGGFARYAVDRQWLVPHFEKMLYDNAQILDLLTWAWQDSGRPLYAERARETVDWLLREMIADGDDGGTRPSGAFASALDADSEGEEGRFYVWSEAEIDAALGDAAELFKAHYDVTPEGNWEGHTILNRSRNPLLKDAETEAALAQARARLLTRRAKRVRPSWDDKVLADWNGLMIAALARAAPVFEQPAWLEAARRAFDVVVAEMTVDGRLCHAWRHGRARHPATLDDYANLCDAALALAEATGEHRFVAQAEDWVAVLDRRYWDAAGGGYFLTADDTEGLILRSKTAHDNAAPAGNGTMVQVLGRLHYLTGRAAYRERAEALVAAFSGELERNFFPLATLLCGAEFLARAVQIVIVGPPEAPATRALRAAVYELSLPDRVLQSLAPDAALPEGHPAHGKGQVDGRPTAYVCRGATCSLPITEPAALTAALSE